MCVKLVRSFDIVCARLTSSLESLRELVLHTWFPSKDALIQQAFAAIQCVYSVSKLLVILNHENSIEYITNVCF